MKIQTMFFGPQNYAQNVRSVNSSNVSSNPVSKSNYCDLNFGNNDKAHYVRVFDPAKEIKDEQKYRNELLNRFYVEIKDKNGKPITNKKGEPVTVLDPKIKGALDSMKFEFNGPHGEKFEGSIKDAIDRFVIYDKNSPAFILGVLHGCSKESIEDIVKYGPDMRKTTRSVFGPGMYFAVGEGDAQDYSSAKLIANLIRTTRPNGELGKFVRFDGAFYENIKNQQVMSALGDILAIEPEPKEYDPFRPHYIAMAKAETPFNVLDEYCRNVICDDLGIDVGYGSARGYHDCFVVFNPDVVQKPADYGSETLNRNDYSYSAYYGY